MLSQLLFGATRIPLLKKGLDAYALRQRAIADNIANVETPGYRRKEVKFEEKLEEVTRAGDLTRTHQRHLMNVDPELGHLKPELEFDPTPAEAGDLNNVDIDREMTELAKNHLQFNQAAHMARMFFEYLKTSIRGM